MNHLLNVIIILIVAFAIYTHLMGDLTRYRWHRRRTKGTWHKYEITGKSPHTFWIGPWTKQAYPDGFGMRLIKSETY